MKSARFPVYLGAALLAAGLLTGCASSQLEGNLGIKGAPDWVNKGTQVVDDKSGHLIHGVGMAPAMNDLSLQTSVADDRARAEVARVLNSFMHVISQDYTASSGTGADQQADQSMSRQIQSITDQNLSGVRILTHWPNPQDKSLWAIAQLDLSQVKDSVANAQGMNAGFRDYFKANADNIFESMKTQGDHK